MLYINYKYISIYEIPPSKTRARGSLEQDQKVLIIGRCKNYKLLVILQLKTLAVMREIIKKVREFLPYPEP